MAGPGVVLLTKPAGLPVFPPHGSPDGDCLLARARARGALADGAAWPPGFDGGIAHRLDTPTSGLVLAARSPADLALLRGWFRDGLLRKVYLFHSARSVPWSTHSIDRPIAHDPRRKQRMVVQRGVATPHRGAWLPARTGLRRLGPAPGGTLWAATIETGVTHQIRVHAAALGLALTGDRLYGGGPPLSEAGDIPSFRLHALFIDGPAGRWGAAPLPLDWPGRDSAIAQAAAAFGELSWMGTGETTFPP